MAKGAAQATSRSWERKEGDFVHWKKADEVWSRQVSGIFRASECTREAHLKEEGDGLAGHEGGVREKGIEESRAARLGKVVAQT